jgi:hypothetical protein
MLQGLTDAQDGLQSVFKCRFDFPVDPVVGFAKQLTSFGMA